MKYAYSFNEENYTGPFESREDAIAEAFSDDPDAECCWIGEVHDVKPEYNQFANIVIEHASQQDEFQDEDLDDWPDETEEQRKDLDAMISKVFAEWMDKHGLRPTHFTVRKANKVDRAEIENANEQGASEERTKE